MTRTVKIIVAVSSAICLTLVGCSLYWYCFAGKPTECSFSRVQAGMTLAQVERILGPGHQVPRERVAQVQGPLQADGTGLKPVVEGDTFFAWTGGGDGFWISFKNGRVKEKYHFVVPLF